MQDRAERKTWKKAVKMNTKTKETEKKTKTHIKKKKTTKKKMPTM